MNRNSLLLIGTALMTVMLFGCATAVDTGSPIAQDWPDSPETPWEQMTGEPLPAAEGWDERLDERRAERPSVGIFDVGYQFYVRGITQIDGARCEHRPTCSRFAFQAVAKHGVVIGTWLGVDRLMRGDRSSIHRRLPTHSVHEGTMYYYDPVEANDFFL